MEAAYKTEYELLNEGTKKATESQIILAMEENGFIIDDKFEPSLIMRKDLDRAFYCIRNVEFDKASRYKSASMDNFIRILFRFTGTFVAADILIPNFFCNYEIRFLFNPFVESVSGSVARIVSFIPLFVNLHKLCYLKKKGNLVPFPIPHRFAFNSCVEGVFSGNDYEYKMIINQKNNLPESTTFEINDLKGSRKSKEYSLYDLSYFLSDFNTDRFWIHHNFKELR